MHCKRDIAIPGVWHFGTYEMHMLRHVMTHIIGHCMTPYKTSAVTLCPTLFMTACWAKSPSC